MKTHLRTALLLSALLPACATNGEGDAHTGASGKADSLTSDLDVTIAQAGAFRDDHMQDVVRIHFGFSSAREPGWATAGDAEVTYDASGASNPVTITVPAGTNDRYLAFALVLESWQGHEVWDGDQFIDLQNPEGSMVRLPVDNSAGYPFTDDCYRIAVQNLDANEWPIRFDGRVTSVLYGFTDQTRADYLSDNDVPWLDVDAEPGQAGSSTAPVFHDGGYKGSMVRLANHVRVPAGWNLVFKPVLNRYSGTCGIDNDSSFLESTPTQTYFWEVAAL